MPVRLKKYEVQREELSNNGLQDVDISITTRELARMIKQAGVDLSTFPTVSFDAPLRSQPARL